jgi:fructose-bisphosphate aldolase class II
MLGGVEEDISVDEGHACLTNPVEAVEFVKQSGCDSLAAAIGTSHGAYKFKGQQSLRFDVIEQIAEKIPGMPIVMHGSSSVPVEEVQRINAAGGTLDPSARGVAENEYLPRREARRDEGEHRHRWPSRLDARASRVLPRQTSGVRFPPAGQVFMQAYADFIAHKNEKLGSPGQLDAIRATL